MSFPPLQVWDNLTARSQLPTTALVNASGGTIRVILQGRVKPGRNDMNEVFVSGLEHPRTGYEKRGGDSVAYLPCPSYLQTPKTHSPPHPFTPRTAKELGKDVVYVLPVLWLPLAFQGCSIICPLGAPGSASIIEQVN